MTALQLLGFLPNRGADGSAHLYAGLVSRNMKRATFAAVCIHADLLQKGERSGQDIRGSKALHLNASVNLGLLTLGPAEASD